MGYAGTTNHAKDFMEWATGATPSHAQFGNFLLSENSAYSYNVRIAWVDRDYSVVFHHTKKYSPTTTRHQAFVSAEYRLPAFAFFGVEGPVVANMDVKAHIKQLWGSDGHIKDTLAMYRWVRDTHRHGLGVVRRTEQDALIHQTMKQYCPLPMSGRLAMRGMLELAKAAP